MAKQGASPGSYCPHRVLLSTDNKTSAGHRTTREKCLVLLKRCTHGTVPFGELGPSVEQPSFGMVPLEIINKMGHVDL